VLYRDDNHLTGAAAKSFAPAIEAAVVTANAADRQ
jgi:hypothetical protein